MTAKGEQERQNLSPTESLLQQKLLQLQQPMFGPESGDEQEMKSYMRPTKAADIRRRSLSPNK